jgi:hypothetical protein
VLAARQCHWIFNPRSVLPVPPRIGPFTFGELIEGVRTQVQCVIQAGDPPLTLRWLKDGVTLPLELGIQVMQDDFSSTLAIPRVSREHAGNYTCIAKNSVKTASVTAQLVVSGNVMTVTGCVSHSTSPHTGTQHQRHVQSHYDMHVASCDVTVTIVTIHTQSAQQVSCSVMYSGYAF